MRQLVYGRGILARTRARAASSFATPGTQFTCFTSTKDTQFTFFTGAKVQILTVWQRQRDNVCGGREEGPAVALAPHTHNLPGTLLVA